MIIICIKYTEKFCKLLIGLPVKQSVFIRNIKTGAVVRGCEGQPTGMAEHILDSRCLRPTARNVINSL